MASHLLDNLNTIAANTMTDRIQMIDVSELHDSPDNFFSMERIEEFADTILGMGGIKDTLVVRPLENGGYEIVSGHRRTAAVRLLIERGENISHLMPCLVQEYEDEESRKLDLIMLNVSQRQLTDVELWYSYEMLNEILQKKKANGEKFGRVQTKLAELLGISTGRVAQLQNIDRNAIDEVKEAVEKGDISVNIASEIAKKCIEEQEQIADDDLSQVRWKDVKAEKPAIESEELRNAGESEKCIKFDTFLEENTPDVEELSESED